MKFILFFASLFVTQLLSAQQWGDYTLYSVQNSNAAALLDTNGTTYHSWTFATNKKTGYSSYMMEGGNIIRTISNQGNSLNGGGMTGAVQISDWNGNVVWDFVYSSSTYCLHHDICPLPNGNVLMISYDVYTAAQMTAAGSSVNHNMWLEKIIEVQPTGLNTGDIVWEWKVFDHLCQNVNPTGANYVTSTLEHPELWNINFQNSAQTSDWMHMNGIDYNPELDQITFSSHNLDEIYVIDHSTTTAEAATHVGGNSGKGGDILYRWGNPSAYGGSGSTILNVVHDAHFIPAGCPNAGYLVGFNNNGVSNQVSCVDLVDTPDNGFGFDITPGSTFLPASYTYRQNCNGHTNNMGNSEQFPNGNMMICIAQQGLIYEIDPSGTVLWTKTINGTIPQAHRYTACYIAGTTPAAPTVNVNGLELTSSAGGGYQWYLNGAPITGANAQTYTALVSGDYQVAIVESGACNSDLSQVVNVVMTAVEDQYEKSFVLYPNPCQDQVTIAGQKVKSIVVLDVLGNCISTQTGGNIVDMKNMTGGLYFIKWVDMQGAVGVERVIKK